MKKTILSLFALCALTTGFANTTSSETPAASSICAPAAPSLVGSWVTTDKSFITKNSEMPEDVLKKFELTFTFTETTVKCAFDIVVEMEQEGMSMSLGMLATLNGTYNREADALDIEFDKSASTFDLYKLDLPKEFEDQLKAAGMTSDFLKKNLGPEMKTKMLSELNEMSGSLMINKLTDTELILQDTDENAVAVSFTRKSAAKKAATAKKSSSRRKK